MRTTIAFLTLALVPAGPATADDVDPAKQTHKVGDSRTDRTGKTMMWIPPGEFMMGSNRGPDKDERPAHKVTITKPFWMDQKEVTRAEFAACVKAGVCVWALRERKRPIKPKGVGQKANWGLKYCGGKQYRAPGDHPLECVDYHEARYFCETWRGARLPTEAEWEWAGRGGLHGKRFPWGNENPQRTRADFGRYYGTGPVGRYPANGYGLFDMAGSVWEWTEDWYDRRLYKKGEQTDPRGPCAGEMKCPGFKHRTMRGGSWITGSLGMRVTYRNHHKTWNRFSVVGVRCAAPVDPAPPAKTVEGSDGDKPEEPGEPPQE